MIKQFAHLCIHTSDLQRTEQFYCDILGLSKKFNFTKDGKLFGFYIDLGNKNFLEFFLSNEKTTNYSSIKHFCLEVEDLDAVTEKLRSAGVEVTDKKLGSDNSLQCWIKDPNGILIEIQQYTEKSSQFTGQDCIANW